MKLSGNGVFLMVTGALLIGIFVGGFVLWNSFFRAPEVSVEVFSADNIKQSGVELPRVKDPNELNIAFCTARGEVVKSLDILGPNFISMFAKIGKKARVEILADDLEIVNRVEKKQVFMGSISAITFAKSRKDHKIKAFLERAGDAPRSINNSRTVPGGVYIVAADADEELMKVISKIMNDFGKILSPTMELREYFQVKTPDPSVYDFLEKGAADGEN